MKNMCKGCMYNKDEYKEYRVDSDETDYYVCTKAEICGGWVRYVRTGENIGPRGDYFDYCRVTDSGSITFGTEEGNYAGGDTLSEDWHPHNDDYWHRVVCNLIWYHEHDKEYFNKIMDMLDNNIELIREWVPKDRENS